MGAKQVIVIRKDLNMRKGKIAAQAAHASLAVVLNSTVRKDKWVAPLNAHRTYKWVLKAELGTPMSEWLNDKFTKICVYVNSESELLDIYQKTNYAGLPCAIIRDAGLTEFNGVPTLTAVAVGPGWEEEVDAITGELPLL